MLLTGNCCNWTVLRGACYNPGYLGSVSPMGVGLGEAEGRCQRSRKQHLENLRRNAQPMRRKYGPLISLPVSNSASNFTGAAFNVGSCWIPGFYPYSATSTGTLKLPLVQRRCAIADTSPSSCHHKEFDALG